MSLLKPIGIAAAIVTLAACDFPPLTSLAALSKVDWATTDANALRVAVSVPETVKLVDDQVRLVGVVSGPNNSAGAPLRFKLTTVGTTGPGLENAPGQVQVFALADAQSRKDFNTFRAEVLKAEEAELLTGDDRDGSLGVDPKVCRTTPDLPTELPVIIFIKTAEIDRFVPLNRSTDLLTDVGSDRADLEAALPPCT